MVATLDRPRQRIGGGVVLVPQRVPEASGRSLEDIEPALKGGSILPDHGSH